MKLIIHRIFVLCLFAFATGCSPRRDLADEAMARIEDTGISGYELDVKARFSTVKITGKVGTEEDRETVVNAAKSVEGVSEVEEFIVVTGRRSTKALPQDVKLYGTTLMSKVSPYPLLGDLQLNFSTSSSGLLIKGTAPSRALVKRIEKFARQDAQGRYEVVTDIDTQRSKGDAQIRSALMNSLNSDFEIDTSRLRVEVRGAVVSISGKTAGVDEKDRILARALMVEGIDEIALDLGK